LQKQFAKLFWEFANLRAATPQNRKHARQLQKDLVKQLDSAEAEQ